ncbi:MAG: hypothetical protein WA656_17925, partial [Pseudolabrys sp.]
CTSEALKGEVVTVDETSRKISIIKLSGVVGSSNPPTPTFFKVQDSLIQYGKTRRQGVLYNRMRTSGNDDNEAYKRIALPRLGCGPSSI